MADREPDPFGAVWCETHRRRECAKDSKRTHVRCHDVAMVGIDACKSHAGVSRDAAKAKGAANLTRIRFRDVAPTEYVDPADVLLWAVTLAHIDLADYRAELRDRDSAVSAEELDRVAKLVDQAGRIAKLALDAKVDERRVRVAESIGERIALLVRGLLEELGHDAADPKVQAIVRRRMELIAGTG